LKTAVAGSISPAQVTLDGRLLLCVRAKVGVVGGELLHGRKMALDAIEPRVIARREVKPDAVLRRPF
jgi:hypothetical protein